MDLLKSQKEEPVECLGQTFANDKERRNHFLKLPDEKLKDPEFRKQEGFPRGTDEAILAMSDPPYYTACPNPWLADFVAYYGKPFTTLRALAGISLMPTGQLTGFDGKLDKLKSCASLVHSELVASIQEALSGLEKIVVISEDIKKALLTGGSPATPEDLRKRFESLLNERCKGKDADKLRFVVE